ncbi:thioredoxin-like protein [Xylogone sp. PMI_703]|nr:thioredoxin-like protein [Xylogone sp. PMI_703]
MPSLGNRILHLYTAPLSGCSARIRIAAHLKSIPLVYHNISIADSQHLSPDYLRINPNGSVPSLVIESPTALQNGTRKTHTITQSPAIIDFLESHFPDPPLLPSIVDWKERAKVMELVSLVACDIQPPQNGRIRKKIISEFGGNGEIWAKYVIERGLGVYESFVERARLNSREGKYSVGNGVTLADVFLIPAVQGGLRVGIELEKWPTIKGIVEECWKLEAFRQGGLGGHGRLIP